MIAWASSEGADASADLQRLVVQAREEFKLAPRTSFPAQPGAPPAERPPTLADAATDQVKVFHSKLDPTADASFRLWAQANREGFYISMRTSRSGLVHRVDCHRLADITWEASAPGWDATKNPKICSTNLKFLQAWASQHGVATSYCHDCDVP